MGTQIQLASTTTGLFPKFLVRSQAAQVWNDNLSAFEAYSTANRTDYEIAMTEQGTASRYYAGTMPSAIAAGDYDIEIREATGEAGALAGTLLTQWDGTNIVESSLGVLVGSFTTSAKADVNAEVDTALVDIGLDHLLSATVAGTDIIDDSIIAQLVSKLGTADWDSFDNVTDSLEAIADGVSATPAEIADAVWDESRSSHTTGGSFGEGVKVSPDGLNFVSTTNPSDVPVNFQEQLNWLYLRFANRVTMSSTLLTVFKDDNVTVITTQVLLDDRTFQDLQKTL